MRDASLALSMTRLIMVTPKKIIIFCTLLVSLLTFQTNAKELGTNDLRLSAMGPNQSTNYVAENADVAFSPLSQVYLVVWVGDDNVDNKFEIFGQFVDRDGTPVGENDFKISTQGPAADPDYECKEPAVAWNPNKDEFMVIWSGSRYDKDNEQEVYGRRYKASTMAPVQAPFLITNYGEPGRGAYDTEEVALAFNPDKYEYLIAFLGESPIEEGGQSKTYPDNGDTVKESEIYGIVINENGLPLSTIFQISTTGPGGSDLFEVDQPSVAYNTGIRRYVVAWDGGSVERDGAGEVTSEELEIHAQIINTNNSIPELVGSNIRISQMGPDGSSEYNAKEPHIAVNTQNNYFLIVWKGDDDDTLGATEGENEIFGQFLDPDGNAYGENFRISYMGPNMDNDFDASDAGIVYNPVSGLFFVVWVGDHSAGLLGNDEVEVWGQHVDADGALQGPLYRLSDVGGEDGNVNYAADNTAVACDAESGRYFVVWEGDDHTSQLINDEFEIFGQLIEVNPNDWDDDGIPNDEDEEPAPDTGDDHIYQPGDDDGDGNSDSPDIDNGSDGDDYYNWDDTANPPGTLNCNMNVDENEDKIPDVLDATLSKHDVNQNGVPDCCEYGPDALKQYDSDQDGLSDCWEIQANLNPYHDERMDLTNTCSLTPHAPMGSLKGTGILVGLWLVGLAACWLPLPLFAQTTYHGVCDASTAVAVDENHILVGEDENEVLMLYQTGVQNSQPVGAGFNLTKLLRDQSGYECDIEASARIGNRIYWITSHGPDKSGRKQPNRHRLFATDVMSSGKEIKLKWVGRYDNLERDIIKALHIKKKGQLNIEALARTPDDKGLLIGFRGPVDDGKAIVVTLVNPLGMLMKRESIQPGKIYKLDLGGLGLRSMAYSPRLGKYFMIAGPQGEGGPFYLYEWKVNLSEPPKKIKKLTWKKGSSPEGLIIYENKQKIQVLQDEGTKRVSGALCKDWKMGSKKSFQDHWYPIE
jgi:hypothetical protein